MSQEPSNAKRLAQQGKFKKPPTAAQMKATKGPNDEELAERAEDFFKELDREIAQTNIPRK